MGVSKKSRFEVFKRDGFTCQYCGCKPPDVVLECDHIRPKSDGGSDEYCNLITSCFNCNRGKGAAGLDESKCSAVERMQKVQVEKLEQLTAFNEMLLESMKKSDCQLDQVKKLVGTALGCSRKTWSLSKKDVASLRTFCKKLSVDDVVDCAHIAYSKKGGCAADSIWRYFCGVCWGKIKESAESD